MGNQSASLVFFQKSVIHGHHIHKHVWIAVVGEELPVDVKDNINNSRVVAVYS